MSTTNLSNDPDIEGEAAGSRASATGDSTSTGTWTESSGCNGVDVGVAVTG